MPVLHPERYSRTGVLLRKLGVVVHDAESGDGAAQTLIRLLQTPGDRQLLDKNGKPTGRMYGAGYTAVTTGNPFEYVLMADPSMGPYAAPPRNKDWKHVCMPGVAAQTREQWLDPLSRNHISGVAKFIYDAHIEDGIPLLRIKANELLAGDRGYCGHGDVTLAWGDSTHTDPGPNFPWDVLAADIQSLFPAPPTPPEDDDMNLILWRDLRFNNAFRVGDSAITISGTVLERDKTAKVPYIEEIHDQMLISCMAASHLRGPQMAINGDHVVEAQAFLANLPADLK